MSRPAPGLAPLFRSEQQLRILAVLFSDESAEFSIGELAERARVAQPTVSREVARLSEHGLVNTRSLGRNRLVTANWRLPWARDLRSILVQTLGVLGRLAEALAGVAGVEEAFVYGSWAARYAGEAGPPPRDVDVVVVGMAELRAVRHACRTVEEDVRLDVNPTVISRERWTAKSPDPFVAQVRRRPLVPIPLESA